MKFLFGGLNIIDNKYYYYIVDYSSPVQSSPVQLITGTVQLPTKNWTLRSTLDQNWTIPVQSSPVDYWNGPIANKKLDSPQHIGPKLDLVQWSSPVSPMNIKTGLSPVANTGLYGFFGERGKRKLSAKNGFINYI